MSQEGQQKGLHLPEPGCPSARGGPFLGSPRPALSLGPGHPSVPGPFPEPQEEARNSDVPKRLFFSARNWHFRVDIRSTSQLEMAHCGVSNTMEIPCSAVSGNSLNTHLGLSL